MDRAEKKKELFKKGYNCGQIITALLADKGGWDETACEDLADMCESCGEICGTLRGGDYCINRYCKQAAAKMYGVPADQVHDRLDKEQQMDMMRMAKRMSKQLYKFFKIRNGSLFCSDLRTDNINESCSKYMDDVVEILESLF